MRKLHCAYSYKPCLRSNFISNIAHSFFFFGHAVWYAGSKFPDQGLNPCPLQSSNHWTAWGVPSPYLFFF